MASLEGKVALITGASEGIGAQLASALRTKRVALCLTARNEDRLNQTAQPSDLVVAADLTLPEARAQVIDRTLARFGRIDILINNAGRGSYYPASQAPQDDAHALFELNFFAPFHLSQLAVPALKQTGGSIVNIGSIGGLVSLPWLPVYCASKFALSSLTASQRMELTRHGVHVMGVYPGYVNTDFQAHAAGSHPPEPIGKGRRFAISPEHCASAIVHGIETRARTVVTPRSGWLLIWLNHLFPALIERRLEAL